MPAKKPAPAPEPAPKEKPPAADTAPAWPAFVEYVDDDVTYPAIETPTGLVVFGLPSGAAELRAPKE